MSVTKSSSSNHNVLFFFGTLLLALALASSPLQAQVVPLQANIDAQAQRRLQEQAAEARRQQRREENIKILIPALSPANLSSPQAQPILRRALAALTDLSAEGFSASDSLQKAASGTSLPPSTTRATQSYLNSTWQNLSRTITPESLPTLRLGQDPKPSLLIPPFTP